MHAPPECLLDAIAMALVCDGEVNEEEITLAVKIACDLPAFAGREFEEVEAAVGEAFERFASEGREARLEVMREAALDVEARIEVLTAAALVMHADTLIDREEEDFTRVLADAVGASEDERAKVVRAVLGA